MPHTTRAQAAAEIAAAAAEDEGDATEDQTRLPASVSRSNLGHRVAAMNAAANNMPIDAPHGFKTSRMKFLNEELAQFRSPQYPNGLCASENFICHSQNGLVVTELAAWKARALNEQRVTGDNTQDSNAHLNAACQAAELALDENAKLSKLSSAEKTRLLKEMELRQAEATRAREAAAMGLDQATMDARHARGPRLSPTQKAEEVFVYGAGGGGGGPGPSGAGADAGASSSSSSAISQHVGVLQKESENTAKVARMAAETDQLREKRLKTEGESKADLDKATLEAATQHRKRDLDIAEKRQEAEAEAGSAESKRRKAETDASASAAAISAAGVAASNEVIAKANAHAIQVKADVEALIAKANAHAIQVKADAEAAAIRAEAEQAAVRAQVALAQVRAQEAQTAMMMRMMEMIAKKE